MLRRTGEFALMPMPQIKLTAFKEQILGDEKWEPTPSQAASKQAILQMAAEGGSITLYGIRVAGWWRYRIETSESGLDVARFATSSETAKRFTLSVHNAQQREQP